MTKISNNKPAPNPQSVFVLNFENWDLQIVWNSRSAGACAACGICILEAVAVFLLVTRLISSVPKYGNLKLGKNATYLTNFAETRKFQITNLK